MIDALFGSKTRVKLLHLFLNNPGKAFYVREITRLIDEQINSVRRELSNMMQVGIVKSDSSNNKLYYEVDQRYEHYVALRAIFTDKKIETATPETRSMTTWREMIEALGGVRIALLSGLLVPGSLSKVDMLLVGTINPVKLKKLIAAIEKSEGRELNYSVLSYEEFYYRLSVHDKFITEILNGKHTILLDTDHVLNGQI